MTESKGYFGNTKIFQFTYKICSFFLTDSQPSYQYSEDLPNYINDYEDIPIPPVENQEISAEGFKTFQGLPKHAKNLLLKQNVVNDPRLRINLNPKHPFNRYPPKVSKGRKIVRRNHPWSKKHYSSSHIYRS